MLWNIYYLDIYIWKLMFMLLKNWANITRQHNVFFLMFFMQFVFKFNFETMWPNKSVSLQGCRSRDVELQSAHPEITHRTIDDDHDDYCIITPKLYQTLGCCVMKN